MFKFTKTIKSIQKELTRLREESMIYKNWRVCNNCATIFERESLISTRFNFDYCAACRPVMKEKRELDAWVLQNSKAVKGLKDEIERLDNKN